MMKPTLQLKMSQQLTMTPQLQQAIRLLQLSSLELQQEIEETLTANPLLEVDGGEENQESQSVAESTTEGGGASFSSDATSEEIEDAQARETQDPSESVLSFDAVPQQLPVDSKWEDVYASYSFPQAGDDGEGRDFESFNSPKETLKSHLLWQLNLTRFSDRDRSIAEAIVEAIGDDGYLRTSLKDIQESCREPEIEESEVEAVLHRIQRFDPIGVGARNLKECLLVQLDQYTGNHPLRTYAEAVVREHLTLLGSRDYNLLRRKLGIDANTLKEVIKLIQACHPKPGDLIAAEAASYVIPDLKVTRQEGQWVLELNSEVSPKLRVNLNYAELIRRTDASGNNTVLRNYLQEARWFIKSLQSRNETLLKVASKIVEVQQGFLEHGEEAMRPLVLHDIASAVDMHESTISRITTHKYIHTPRGIYELKYFFSSHVSTQGGGECSSTAIRALIKKLVAHENPGKPLSDQKIARFLKEQGIYVARRTVAKYREALSISASNARKCLV